MVINIIRSFNKNLIRIKHNKLKFLFHTFLVLKAFVLNKQCPLDITIVPRESVNTIPVL